MMAGGDGDEHEPRCFELKDFRQLYWSGLSIDPRMSRLTIASFDFALTHR